VTTRGSSRGGPYELRVPLSTDPGEVPRLRHLVRKQLRAWRLNGAEEVTILLVSELVTNALLHGRPPLELRLTAAGDRPAALEFPPPDSPHGRGIEIVAALSTRWGSIPSTHGKVVWFEVDAFGSR